MEKVPEDDYFEVQVSGGGYPKQWRRRLLADVLQRRAESDLTKIRDQLRRVLRDLPGTIVLTGGGANLDGLSDVARLVFGADVESRGPRELTGRRDLATRPHFAIAMGLCRYGLIQRRRSPENRAQFPLAQMGRAIGDGLRRVTGHLRKAQ